jgi:hypothetical protein
MADETNLEGAAVAVVEPAPVSSVKVVAAVVVAVSVANAVTWRPWPSR